jgi:hypothetical protein
MSSAYRPPSSPRLIFVARITPCSVDGIAWPLFAFSILSDTTSTMFSFAVDQPKDIVMKKEIMKPINGRGI